MFDPVFTYDGHTYHSFHFLKKLNKYFFIQSRYERNAIQKWFLQGHKTSPLTDETLQHFMLTPNHFAKNVVYQFLEQNKLTEKFHLTQA